MIGAVDLVPIALPFRRPYVTARGELSCRGMIVVRLRSDAGEVGSGEAVPLSLRGDASLAELLAELERCRDVLIGSEPALELRDACAGVTSHAPALAAIDMALLDLVGRLAGEPGWRMLGARSASPVTCNATLIRVHGDQLAHDALEWFDRGFRTFKLKSGDEPDVACVRDAVGSEARIRIDLNGTWHADEAIEQLGKLVAHDVELVEQPCAGIDELTEVRSGQPIPVAADESVSSPDDAARALEAGACDFATVKLAKVGGFEPARRIAELVPVYLSSALDGPCGIAAAAHLAQVIPGAGLAHGLATELLFSEALASASIPLLDGELYPGNDPGLGVELDERALARLALDVS